ncbi:MAG TPA: fibronectin type III domain-containing protein [Desulfobacteria bacterium]|nr:fibronectin type III domain-containing protein [Desulfobacteria bacterium]
MKVKLFIFFAILFLCLQVSIVSAIDPLVEYADAVWSSNLDTTPTNLTNSTSTALPRPLIEYQDTTFNFELKECPEELTNNASKALPRPLIEYPNTAFNFELKEYPEELTNNASKTLPRPMVEYSDTVLSKALFFPKELIDDNLAPIISKIELTSVTDTSATITWDTDEFADSVVEHGETSGVYTGSEQDPLYVKNHIVELTGLSPGTRYYFVVNSTDQSGNSNESSEYSFNTTGTKQVLDTGSGTYPSIAGMHNGTITLNQTITAHKLYTYPCAGTGGHTEQVIIWNESKVVAEAYWNGYQGDWHTIPFNETFTLYANETYNYTIRTGSYPQIIHEPSWNATGGMITCTEFTDVSGNVYTDWIPAIRLE